VNPLISIVCPTRERPAKLKRCIESIVSTASSPHNYEVLLRCHSDDQPTIDLLPELMKLGPIYPYIGKPLSYNLNRLAFTEAVLLATSPLMWIMNDDVVVSGQGWDTLISKLPENHLGKPELHQSGLSNYTMDEGVPFYVIPIHTWLTSPRGSIFPGEVELRNRLVGEGWKTWWMKGIKVWHDWQPDGLNGVK
jgi:hypothetical protein